MGDQSTMQPIKPVGLCPRCRVTTRQPGRSYCAACSRERGREERELTRRHPRTTPLRLEAGHAYASQSA